MNGQDLLAKIANAFQEQGLATPWIPANLAHSMVERSSGVFASHAGEPHLYDLEGFVTQYLADPVPVPAVALGFAGHGLASQGAHYYLTGPRLGIFLQLRWGTLFDQPDDDAPFWSLMVKQARELYTAADSPAPGSFPPGQRLVVVESYFNRPRFAWVDPQAEQPVTWTFLSSRGAVSLAAIDIKRRMKAAAPLSVSPA